MLIYLLRHAQAEDRIDGLDHPERRLTPKGRRQATTMGTFARRQQLALDLALTSPFQRATETLAHFTTAYATPLPQRHAHWLAIDTPTTLMLEHLRDVAAHHPRLLLVGHEPDLSTALAALLGTSSPAAYKLRKASMTCLECPDGVPLAPGTATLRWSLTPDLLDNS